MGAPAAAQLPPISDAASAEHHPGKIVWADLVIPDLESAERFYTGLLGWTFQDIRLGHTDYAVASLGGQPIAGLLQRAPRPGGGSAPQWLTYIAVASVDSAAQAALRNGASMVVEPRSYPRRGRQAVLRDPQGAIFGMLASTSGDTADLLADPGDWIWSTLLTNDVDIAVSFYQTVFGYDAVDLSGDDGREHVVLSTGDYARAGAANLPATARDPHPRWLDFVRVADAAEAAAKAQTLGGQVLVAPHADRYGSLVAVLADPAGAAFGVIEWSESDPRMQPPVATVIP